MTKKTNKNRNRNAAAWNTIHCIVAAYNPRQAGNRVAYLLEQVEDTLDRYAFDGEDITDEQIKGTLFLNCGDVWEAVQNGSDTDGLVEAAYDGIERVFDVGAYTVRQVSKLIEGLVCYAAAEVMDALEAEETEHPCMRIVA